jgi:polygalacturonase
MPHDIDRRTLFRLSALAGASATLLPLLADRAAATTPAARLTGAFSASPGEGLCGPDAAADAIVESVKRPAFPPRVFPVTRFGAVGDGVTDCTTAFRDAIIACNRAGGGHVLVPGGTFFTGAIHLLSDVDLHLERGATILFSQDPNAYLPVVFSRWQGIELMNYSPFIYAFGQRNIAVTGEGVLNGQADAGHWWNFKPSENADFAVLETMADNGVPVEQRVFGPGYHLPPPMIQPLLSENVLIEGVTIENSPFWHMNPNLCRSVIVKGVTVNSSGPNTDGCDPESCDGVVIDGVTFNAGDDCIAIKSGRDSDGRRVGVPCQNVVIQNCSFANGHGGVTVGSEMTGGVKNVYARDLTMNSPGLQSGHRLKANSLRGGFIENTNVYRVTAGTIGGPVLWIDANYSGQTGDFPPLITDINLTGWTVASCAQAWQIAGEATDPVGTVTLKDIAITTMTGTNSAKYISDLQLIDVTVGGVPITS